MRPRWVDPEGEPRQLVRIAFAYLGGRKTAASEGGTKNYDAGDGNVEHNERPCKFISADNRVHGIGHGTENTKYVHVPQLGGSCHDRGQIPANGHRNTEHK